MYALALGYEDVNDHAALRHDLALQTAAGRDRALASPSTLSRFDNAAGRDWAWSVHEVMVETFIASFDTPPEDLTLDFDATDDAVHGRQEGRFFHGYYDHYSRQAGGPLPAALCVLRRAVAGELPAPVQD